MPYDVVNRAEAEALARGNPRSFLHVGRSDIDLPGDVDPYDPRVYAQARAALERFLADGTLRRDASPALYLYRQEMDGQGANGHRGLRPHRRLRARHHPEARKDAARQGGRPHAPRPDAPGQRRAGLSHLSWACRDRPAGRADSPYGSALRLRRPRWGSPRRLAGAPGCAARGSVQGSLPRLRGRRASPLGERLARGQGASRARRGGARATGFWPCSSPTTISGFCPTIGSSAI